MKKLSYLVCFLLISYSIKAQKVGLVLSGGGAKGLAHIGVLKALEENHIPIDYITGTSMGGIVGGMYAAGYTPSAIEYIALSNDFQNWVNGRLDKQYQYFFSKKPDNPSVLKAKLEIDTSFNASLRSNLINDIPLNFAMLELLAQASANAKNNFDSLFVPYRCLVSDIFTKKAIPVRNGSLVEAIRGTMAVPLVFRPVKVNDRYVFDGGLYNNFPIDVMQEEFRPDYIIGVNVSSKKYNEYPKDQEEKLANRFLMYMFLSNPDSAGIGPNSAYIQPDISNHTSTNFSSVQELIQLGYDAAMAQMPKILEDVRRRNLPEEVKTRRQAFNSKNPDLVFENLYIRGANSQQQSYIERIFRSKGQKLDLFKIKAGFSKLVADENFETVYPRISYIDSLNTFDFDLEVKTQKNFKVDFGGSISTRPISNAYLGLQYSILDKNAYTFGANFYSGRFYESIQTSARMDIPSKKPLFFEAGFTYNHWNYLSTSTIIVDKVEPTFVEQSDRLFALKVGTPIGQSGKIEFQTAFVNFEDQYSPNDSYISGDIFDKNYFNGFSNSLSLSINSLNRKQYATEGINVLIGLTQYWGEEHYQPGNVLRNEPIFPTLQSFETNRGWLKLKSSIEHYPLSGKRFSLGYLAEMVLSNRPLFNTYKSTLLTAPSFNPLQDSKSIFLTNFRANSYLAMGVKNILHLRKNLDFRVEGYLFQAYQKFELISYQDVAFGPRIPKMDLAATAALVYHSPLGPINLSINHYENHQRPWGMMFHAGFLLYNKRSFE
ncbi:MAG: hypothetical protein RI924_839 [Bacteroidota bacterium]|jgi:NTE family protein